MQAHEPGVGAASAGETTVAVQRHLDALAGDAPADPIVRSLLGRSVERLERLCRKQLRGRYPRLTRAPVGVETGDVLAAIVERLLRATGEVRPQNVRQFFGLANQHIRWELNDLVRGLDKGPRRSELPDEIEQPGVTDSGVAPAILRLLAAIEELPQENREVFDLVRVQGLSHAEAAEIAGVATKTIQRRLREATLLLAERVGFIEPPDGTTPA
jgi:RNA polymerase sigma-70 factor (ECF subfamily)